MTFANNWSATSVLRNASVDGDITWGTGSYVLDVRVPWSAVGPRSGEPFLIDIYALLNPLGDAHSGGRSSLSKKFESDKDMSFAAEAITPTPRDR